MGENRPQTLKEKSSLMVQVLERNNLIQALKQVTRNKGAAGIDGMQIADLSAYLKANWLIIKEQIETGCYQPQAVLRVEIPKPNGGKRKLGIPTVIDRLIQQAITQVLSPIFEAQFHHHSYGFRPKRNAHQAIYQVQCEIKQGRTWVVDLDLEAFFDRVNHDRLMQRLKADIKAPDLLRLINRYLKAGTSINGQEKKTTEGVPQGSPLSPLLSNIVLNELDWELEKRGHTFARYADDCQIYVGSQRAGERVKQSISKFIDKILGLKVNENKSAVARPWERKFLGFTFSARRGHKIKVSGIALEKLKATVRKLCRRTRGHSVVQIIAELRKSLLGWKAYFGIAEIKSPQRDLEKWIRRKLRCYIWKQWGRSGYRKLRRHGVARQLAWNTAKSAHGPWRLSASPALYYALPNKYFRRLGLPALVT
jgi:group II intron reverse transcriptase/maturase